MHIQAAAQSAGIRGLRCCIVIDSGEECFTGTVGDRFHSSTFAVGVTLRETEKARLVRGASLFLVSSPRYWQSCGLG